MNIIQSLDRKTKMYEPDYSEELDEDGPGKIVILQGKVQRCKNGRKSIRPLKQSKMKKDLSADKSFAFGGDIVTGALDRKLLCSLVSRVVDPICGRKIRVHCNARPAARPLGEWKEY